MTTPSLSAELDASIQILATCLVLTNENYQRLLNQPESLSFCKEAGRSLRTLSDRYAQVMLAVLSYPAEFDDDDDILEDPEEGLSETDLNDLVDS